MRACVPAAWGATERDARLNLPAQPFYRPLPPARTPPPQGVPPQETRQHVAAMVEGLRGRQGSKYAELLAAAAAGEDGGS